MINRTYDGIAKVRENLTKFKSREAAVKSNPEYSDVGRTNKLAALKVESDAYRPKAYGDLELELRLLKNDQNNFRETKAFAQKKFSDQWDYNRLAYMGEVAKSAVKKATRLDEVVNQYNRVRDGEDLHEKRAWSEVAPGLVIERFGSDDALKADQFKRQADRDLEAIKTLPEQEGLDQRSSEIAQRAMDFSEVTQAAHEFYSPPSAYISDDEFTRLRDAVSVATIAHPEDATHFFEFHAEIGDLPAASGGK